MQNTSVHHEKDGEFPGNYGEGGCSCDKLISNIHNYDELCTIILLLYITI